ncbi:MAG: DNA-binding MarR family transcriptional regulator/GNAT superfamily N-acetyltransferase [Candidatus Azotimanducaceae bacterium]|jgi:DNA-binding MarR family transcriptional regulator/GNAT superfamily N-acetyltransferase
MSDFLAELGALALGSRLKRLSDALMQDGVRVYQSLDAGFEPRWFPVFFYLYRKGPTAITELARGLGVSHPGVNKIGNELIQTKLVAPYRDRSDKRKRVLALTRLGRDKIEALEPAWRDIRRALQSAVDEGGGDFLSNLSALEKSFRENGFVMRFDEQHGKPDPLIKLNTFRPEYAEAFRLLNTQWIEHHFMYLEEADHNILDDPKGSILAQGGELLFAIENETVLGACALIKLDQEKAELVKMAVAVSARGKRVGLLLGREILELARERGFKKVCLESNRILTPAIALYKKLGFVEQPFPKTSEYSRADIYMEFLLSPSISEKT